jgi:hypothetical protein
VWENNFFGYDMDPPPPSPLTKIIKTLGEKLCKMDPSELSHSSLMASRDTKKAGSPRKAMMPKRKDKEATRKISQDVNNDRKEKKNGKKYGKVGKRE